MNCSNPKQNLVWQRTAETGSETNDTYSWLQYSTRQAPMTNIPVKNETLAECLLFSAGRSTTCIDPIRYCRSDLHTSRTYSRNLSLPVKKRDLGRMPMTPYCRSDSYTGSTGRTSCLADIYQCGGLTCRKPAFVWNLLQPPGSNLLARIRKPTVLNESRIPLLAS